MMIIVICCALLLISRVGVVTSSRGWRAVYRRLTNTPIICVSILLASLLWSCLCGTLSLFIVQGPLIVKQQRLVLRWLLLLLFHPRWSTSLARSVSQVILPSIITTIRGGVRIQMNTSSVLILTWRSSSRIHYLNVIGGGQLGRD